ncbi:MAG: aquaporin [Planctomycetes bacterium]|nr:aquaporin [Planctomycetota bacterium]
MLATLRTNWPMYLCEAAGLGLFMIVAAVGGVLLFHPASALVMTLPDPELRLWAMGLTMGLTAVLLIGSPLGKRSGAHMNPATTLTFWRLRKVAGADVFGYIAGQLLGGIAGVGLARWLLGEALAAPEVAFVKTVPGPDGAAVAFGTEFGMTFVLMSVVLRVSQNRRWNHLTGLAAGTLVALFIGLLAPLSGMSLNPARTIASAVFAGDATALWVYLLAPFLGMGLAAEVFVRGRGLRSVLCARLHHGGAYRCIFRCSFGMAATQPACRQTSIAGEPALNPWTTTTSS